MWMRPSSYSCVIHCRTPMYTLWLQPSPRALTLLYMRDLVLARAFSIPIAWRWRGSCIRSSRPGNSSYWRGILSGKLLRSRDLYHADMPARSQVRLSILELKTGSPSRHDLGCLYLTSRAGNMSTPSTITRLRCSMHPPAACRVAKHSQSSLEGLILAYFPAQASFITPSHARFLSARAGFYRSCGRV